MAQCAYRCFRLVRFTYLRCCFQFVLSLSLVTLALYSCFCFGCFRSGPTHPSFSQVSTSVFSFYLLLILLLFHLFSGGRDAYVDRARCFKCHKLGDWARECTVSWDSPRSAYRKTTFTPGYSYSPYRFVTEPTLNPVQSRNVFDEKVADISQVHCDSELFAFEIDTIPPCVNLNGNLRRNFEFWKRIGTPSFIRNVIESFAPLLDHGRFTCQVVHW